MRNRETPAGAADPLAPGLPAEAARAAIGVPDRRLAEALARPPLVVSDGMIKVADRAGGPAGAGLPVAAAVRALQALGTTRRVAIPLLEYLDAADTTERLPDDRRRLRASPANVVDPGLDHHATCSMPGSTTLMSGASGWSGSRTC